MKTIKSVFFVAILFVAANATAQKATQQPMPLDFAQDTHNFGDIEKDKAVMHDFTFTNTSDKEVTITGVKPSCGCTAPEYPKTAIKPGATAVITARFDAKKQGPFSKTLTVSTNITEETKTLYIKGKVVEAQKIEN